MLVKQPLLKLVRDLREDRVFLALLFGLAGLSLARPSDMVRYPSLVDWPTIAALTGLLALTQGLEVSGALHRLGYWLVRWMPTERAAALCLVLAAAALSTVLTNDVALFVVVPLTLGISRLTGMPATRLIVFEALAVNVGSALTPIGNPQNIFLWQLSQVSFVGFIEAMLPLVALLMVVLAASTAIGFSGRSILARDDAERRPVDRHLLGVSLGLYVPFLIATDLHHAGLAAVAILIVFLVMRPAVLARLDWGLLLVFVLMFIDLRLIATLEPIRQAFQSFGLTQASHLYWAAIGASQAVSNVPATIALAEYSTDWRVMAYGVNVGGFGFMLGSMANLIALRLSGDRRAWLTFHAYSIPALLISAAIGHGLLFGGSPS